MTRYRYFLYHQYFSFLTLLMFNSIDFSLPPSRLVLSSVVQNCQVDICQAVDGDAVRVFTSRRSVQIRLGQFNLYQLFCAA